MVTGEWCGERTQAGWQAGTTRQRSGREWRRWRPLLLRPSPLTQGTAVVLTARPSFPHPATPGRTTPCPTASDGPEPSRGATRASDASGSGEPLLDPTTLPLPLPPYPPERMRHLLRLLSVLPLRLRRLSPKP